VPNVVIEMLPTRSHINAHVLEGAVEDTTTTSFTGDMEAYARVVGGVDIRTVAFSALV
jgi:hypothetical protein